MALQRPDVVIQPAVSVLCQGEKDNGFICNLNTWQVSTTITHSTTVAHIVSRPHNGEYSGSSRYIRTLYSVLYISAPSHIVIHRHNGMHTDLGMSTIWLP